MTLQQEAYEKLMRLPDESVRWMIALIDALERPTDADDFYKMRQLYEEILEVLRKPKAPRRFNGRQARGKPVLSDEREEKIRRNLKDLEEFASLERNWDGYDADPLPEAAVDRAREVIPKLKIQPKVFPTAVDAVQLDYRKESGYLAIKIWESGPYTIYRRDGQEKGRSFSVQSVEELNDVVGDFYE